MCISIFVKMLMSLCCHNDVVPERYESIADGNVPDGRICCVRHQLRRPNSPNPAQEVRTHPLACSIASLPSSSHMQLPNHLDRYPPPLTSRAQVSGKVVLPVKNVQRTANREVPFTDHPKP
jgi:hypothetical protein